MVDRAMRGRPRKTVLRGICPRCGLAAETPGSATLHRCGQWLVNRLSPILHGHYLYPRRAPNKEKAPSVTERRLSLEETSEIIMAYLSV
jgi:hypothetical protein